jgi:hypothetical protein
MKLDAVYRLHMRVRFTCVLHGVYLKHTSTYVSGVAVLRHQLPVHILAREARYPYTDHAWHVNDAHGSLSRRTESFVHPEHMRDRRGRPTDVPRSGTRQAGHCVANTVRMRETSVTLGNICSNVLNALHICGTCVHI